VGSGERCLDVYLWSSPIISQLASRDRTPPQEAPDALARTYADNGVSADFHKRKNELEALLH